MKSISVDELRRSITSVIQDVEAGEVYELTRHDDRVALIVPAVSSARLIPRTSAGPARTSQLERHELRTAASIDELLADMKGEW